jgi:hypothetical protein
MCLCIKGNEQDEAELDDDEVVVRGEISSVCPITRDTLVKPVRRYATRSDPA